MPPVRFLGDVALHVFFCSFALRPPLMYVYCFFSLCVCFTQAVGLPDIPGLPEASTFYILCAYIVFAFTVGAPKLYVHMIRQREKQLRGGGGGGKVKAS